MIANFVDGAGQSVGNNHIFWTYADALKCKVNRFDCNADLRPALMESLGQKNIWVVYSYGMANLWRWLNHRVDITKDTTYKDLVSIDHLICIAGVPRWDFGEIQGSLWHIPPCIKKATAFNVNSFPISAPIQNPSNDYINIEVPNCPILAHVTIVHSDLVKNKILSMG